MVCFSPVRFGVKLTTRALTLRPSRRASRGGGGLPFITDGDARRNFQKQPLKVTILGVALANFIPQKLPWKFSIIEIAQEY